MKTTKKERFFIVNVTNGPKNTVNDYVEEPIESVEKPTQKKYLSDVIDWQRDIEPYRIIEIIAGVGAGKNTWVQQLADEERRILFITSRRITANVQAQRVDGKRWIDLDHFFERGFGLKAKANLVVTNAGIEKFVRSIYKENEEKTFLWNFFDCIVLDEAHSLVTDATFTDAPFHVLKFLKKAYQENKNAKIILMTGTPQLIDKWLFSKELLEKETVKRLDFRKDCINVTPDKVCVTKESNAIPILQHYLDEGKRIVYFTERIGKIKFILDKLIEKGVDESKIGFSFSEDKKDRFTSEQLKKKEEIEKVLEETETIPEDIQLLLSTYKNKEGININDDDIEIMLAEGSMPTDIIQMAGRVRKGVNLLYILYDTNDSLAQAMLEACTADVSNTVNAGLKEYQDIKRYYKWHCPELRLLSLESAISFLERNYPYVRYNYFSKSFEAYSGKIRGNYFSSGNWIYDKLERWNDSSSTDGSNGYTELCDMFSYDWYEGKIFRIQEDFGKSECQEQKARIEQLLANAEGELLTKEKQAALLADINKIHEQIGEKTYKVLGPLIKKYGYEIRLRIHRSNDKAGIRIGKIDKD